MRRIVLHLTASDGTVDNDTRLHWVASDSWTEDTITGADRPEFGEESDGWRLPFADGPQEHNVAAGGEPLVRWQQTRALLGDSLLSLGLRSEEGEVWYHSSEATPSLRPSLEVFYEEGVLVDRVAIENVAVSSGSVSNLGLLNVGPRGSISQAVSFVKFDIASLPPQDLVAGFLRMHAVDGYAFGGDGNTYTRYVADDTWTESEMTWDNQPEASEEALGSWWLWFGPETPSQNGTNTSPALLERIAAELDAGDSLLSLRLDSPGYETSYAPRDYEDEALRPFLRILHSATP